MKAVKPFSIDKNLGPLYRTSAALLRKKDMNEKHGSIQSFRIMLYLLFLLAWTCSVASIALSLGSLIAQSDKQYNQEIAKMGISIGIFNVVILFPIILFTIVRSRAKQIRKRQTTPFQRWHGYISILLSVAIITITAVEFRHFHKYTISFKSVYPFIIKSKIRHVQSLAILILCLVIGCLLTIASILIICKPGQARDEDNLDNKSIDSFNFVEKENDQVFSKENIDLSDWQYSVPRLDFTPSPTHSIPRKKVDYFAYFSEQDFLDDESTQLGHTRFSSINNQHNGWKEERKGDKESQEKNSTPAVIVTIPARAKKRATIHSQKEVFQSLGSACLNIRNSM